MGVVGGGGGGGMGGEGFGSDRKNTGVQQEEYTVSM